MDKIEKLDVVRGIAILLVFGYHSLIIAVPSFRDIQYNSFFVAPDNDKLALLLSLTPFGWGSVGVQLFLVVSGFLIHLGYLKGGFQPIKFYNKRFWRIYPPYLLALIFFAFTIGGSSFDVISHLGLFHNLSDATFFTINPSFWSLALEMQLYLIYPLFLFLHKKYGLNKATGLVAFVSLASIIIGLWLGLIGSMAFVTSVLTQWIVWVLGAYLGEKFYQGERIYRGHWSFYLFGLGLLIGLKLTILYSYLAPVLFALYFMLVMDCYLHTQFKYGSGLGKILKMIGLCSYSIYLFHQPFLDKTIAFLSTGYDLPFLFLAATGAFVFYFIIGWASYKLIELPSINLGRAFYKRLIRVPILHKFI